MLPGSSYWQNPKAMIYYDCGASLEFRCSFKTPFLKRDTGFIRGTDDHAGHGPTSKNSL